MPSSSENTTSESFKIFRFFYYMKREHLEYFLETGNLKVTQLSKSNDPLELLTNVDYPSGKPRWEEAIRGEEPNVVCLSSRVSSSAMWGHYADSHRGVCLVFDLPISKISIKQPGTDYQGFVISSKKDLNKTYIMYKVEYKKKRDIQPYEPSNKIFWHNQIQQAVATKADDWAYESEYRILLADDDANIIAKNGLLFFDGIRDYFKGVILGLNCVISHIYIRKLITPEFPVGNMFIATTKIHDNFYQIKALYDETTIEDTNIEELKQWASIIIPGTN